MELDNELVKFNPYRCKALGLTPVEARCLNFVRRNSPLDAWLRDRFPEVYVRLEMRGLIERVDGAWRLTEAGRSKLRVLLEGR